jgi:hypothetical protein
MAKFPEHVTVSTLDDVTFTFECTWSMGWRVRFGTWLIVLGARIAGAGVRFIG